MLQNISGKRGVSGKVGRWIGLAAALVAGISATGTANAFEPDRDVTIVVTTSPGGGNDRISRTLAAVIEELQLTKSKFIIENRVGGSGAVGNQYVARRKGDPYIWANFAAAFFTTPLLGQSPVSYKDFTPLAMVAEEPYIMAVPANSDIKSLEDIRKAGSMLSGTEGVMAGPALLANQLKSELKIQVDVVPFGGQSEVISALLGGHIQVMFGVPTVVLPLIEDKQLRPLAVSAKKRMEALPDVPTFKELGYNIVLTQPRGFVLPADVPEDARQYWAEVIKKAVNSENWRKQYLQKARLDPVFISGKDLEKEFEDISNGYEKLMSQIAKQ